MKKIKIDKTKCIGCGTCAALCPQVFELGSDAKAKVKPEAKEVPCIQTAIQSCPAGAIKTEGK